jgi:hypothetical protein
LWRCEIDIFIRKYIFLIAASRKFCSALLKICLKSNLNQKFLLQSRKKIYNQHEKLNNFNLNLSLNKRRFNKAKNIEILCSSFEKSWENWNKRVFWQFFQILSPLYSCLTSVKHTYLTNFCVFQKRATLLNPNILLASYEIWESIGFEKNV